VPNRSWAAVFVAIACVFAGTIESLSQGKHFYSAIACFLIAISALIAAYVFAKHTLYCDAVLMLVFPEPNLIEARWGSSYLPPWMLLENRGKDDAFDVTIRPIRNRGYEAGFHSIPVVSGSKPQSAPPHIVVNGRVHPIIDSHLQFAKALSSGTRKPNTDFNFLTEVKIEFKDKDGFSYIATNIFPSDAESRRSYISRDN